MVVLKCSPLFTPLFGPIKLSSNVKELIKLNSRHITTRPQVSFDFWTAKQLSSKLNISEFDWKSLQNYSARAHLHWKNFLLVSVLWLGLVVTKHKSVTSNWMSVEVAIEEDFSWLQSSFHHQFRVVVYWVELRWTCYPLSVQVDSHQRASVVSNDNTVWVLHWNNFENKSVPQVFGLLRVAYQKLNYTVHHPGSVTFAGMNAGSQYHRLSNRNFMRIRTKVRHNEHVDIVTC